MATETCTGDGECCDGLACDTTSLGKVCCGNEGASCATANGEDCCGALECVAGACRGNPGGPALLVFPVRGKHDVGYQSAATGDPAQWTCDDAHSNSDFVPGTHLGNDIWAKRGTPVAATVNGTLRYTGFTSYSGNAVTIVTDDGWYHFMCHMDHLAPGMVDGRHVTAGEIVGAVGNTGTASNGVVHLHYSIYKNDNYDGGIDPWTHLHAVEHAVCPN